MSDTIAQKKVIDFCLPDENNIQICLKDLKGKWVVLFFYLEDDTEGCTIEAQAFSKMKEKFDEYGAVILGISKDNADSHQAFIQKYDLQIRLLSDEDLAITKAYAAFGKKKSVHGDYEGVIRTTVLISAEQELVHEWFNVNPEGHAEEVYQFLQKQ